MKKAFYMMAAAAIALSSCSSEETTDVAKSSSITFRTSVGLNSRALELTGKDGVTNMTKMTVSAFDGDNAYFANKVFEKGDNNFFEAKNFNPTWPKNGSLTFVAYSHIGDTWGYNVPTLTKTGATITGFKPKTDIKDQHDVVFAYGTGSQAANETSGVELNFEHILSQIKIVVKNTDADLHYSIKGIRIASVSGSADYAFAHDAGKNTNSHTWTNSGTANAVYETVFENPITLQNSDPVDLTDKCNADGVAGGAMIIPQTVTSWAGTTTEVAEGFENFVGKAYISLLINVKRGNTAIYPASGNGYGWAAVALPKNTKWDAGNKYIYTLDMTNGCGKVDPVKPNPEGSTEVKPGTDDSQKGDNIFGKTIKFTVKVVKDWDDAFAGTEGGNIKM